MLMCIFVFELSSFQLDNAVERKVPHRTIQRARRGKPNIYAAEIEKSNQNYMDDTNVL